MSLPGPILPAAGDCCRQPGTRSMGLARYSRPGSVAPVCRMETIAAMRGGEGGGRMSDQEDKMREIAEQDPAYLQAGIEMLVEVAKNQHMTLEELHNAITRVWF